MALSDKQRELMEASLDEQLKRNIGDVSEKDLHAMAHQVAVHCAKEPSQQEKSR